MADFKGSGLFNTHWRHHSFAWILENHYGSSMELTMEEKITLIHILLHKQLILMRVFTSNDQVVFRCDEPTEFFKPKHLSIFIWIPHLFYLMLFKISESSLLSCLDSYDGRINSLLFLLLRFLLDLKVFTNVQLRWNLRINFNFHNWIKVRKPLIINLKHLILFFIVINCIQNKRNLILFKIHLIN